MTANEELKKLLDRLATQRDELIVKAHLARLEAQDEWAQLENSLSRCAKRPPRPLSSPATAAAKYSRRPSSSARKSPAATNACARRCSRPQQRLPCRPCC